jgi:hypothetical protein
LLPHGTAFEFLVANGVEIMRATPPAASVQAKTVRGVAANTRQSENTSLPQPESNIKYNQKHRVYNATRHTACLVASNLHKATRRQTETVACPRRGMTPRSLRPATVSSKRGRNLDRKIVVMCGGGQATSEAVLSTVAANQDSGQRRQRRIRF